MKNSFISDFWQTASLVGYNVFAMWMIANGVSISTFAARMKDEARRFKN